VIKHQSRWLFVHSLTSVVVIDQSIIEEEMSDEGGNDVELGNDDGVNAGERDYTEVTEQNYCSRMKDACTGVLIGFLLFFGSIGLLIWNEGRTVKRAKDLDEGQENVIQLDISSLSSVNQTLSDYENKLIYVTGDLSTTDSIVDPVFGIGTAPTTVNSTTNNNSEDTAALKLYRNVEMYQWKETSSTRTEKTKNGGTRRYTTYSYSETWSSTLINSQNFKEQRSDRVNPTSLPFETLNLQADPILLDNQIQLGERVIDFINWFEPINDVQINNVPDETLQTQLTTYNSNGFYYGNGSNASPQVGDTRIAFSAVYPDTISIVALYRPDNTLDSYTTSRGGTLLLVKRGTIASDVLFQQAEGENTTLAWVLRFVGFVVMVIGILLILQPIATAVDIIPFVGDFMESGLECCIFPMVAFFIAIPTTLFVVSLAWLAYRPQWSVPILVGSALIMILLFVRHRRRNNGENDPGKIDNNQYSASEVQGGSTPVEYNANPYSASVPVVQGVEYNNNANPYSASAPPATTTGGFAGALDSPPPSELPTAIPVPVVEPEVQVDSEPEKPFVPQVFKP